MVLCARCRRRWVSAIIADTLQNCSIKPSGCKGQRVRVPWRLRSKRSAHYSLRISLPLTRPWNEALTAQIKGCSEDSIPPVLHALSCVSAPWRGGGDGPAVAFNPRRSIFSGNYEVFQRRRRRTFFFFFCQNCKTARSQYFFNLLKKVFFVLLYLINFLSNALKQESLTFSRPKTPKVMEGSSRDPRHIVYRVRGELSRLGLWWWWWRWGVGGVNGWEGRGLEVDCHCCWGDRTYVQLLQVTIRTWELVQLQGDLWSTHAIVYSKTFKCSI